MRFHKDGTLPNKDEVFVFGSNLSGIHGGGAARAALDRYGAVWGVSEGHQGRSYAIPTVQEQIKGPLPLYEIANAVRRFLQYAYLHPELSFFVTRVGCHLAGYKNEDVAPMFRGVTDNCSMPEPWAKYLREEKISAATEKA